MSLEKQIQQVREEIKNDAEGKILIVGGRTTNFPLEARDEKRLVFWDSQHYDNPARIKFIPNGVKWIFITRFVGHDVIQKIKSIVTDNIKFINIPQSTGELRKVIKENMKLINAVPVKAGELQTKKPSFMGWIRENVNLEASTIAEAKRLLTTVKVHFPKVDINRFKAEISRVKYQRNLTTNQVKKYTRKKANQAVLPEKNAVGMLQEFRNHLKSAKEAIEILELDCEQIELQFRSMEIEVKKGNIGK